MGIHHKHGAKIREIEKREESRDAVIVRHDEQLRDQERRLKALEARESGLYVDITRIDVHE